jgi:hypothetical protein
MRAKQAALGALALVLGACATLPTGPNVMVLPGTKKTFDQFRLDEYECRDYAYRAIGGQSAEQAATRSGVASAAVGTAIGAAAGAAIGGSQGAAVGAGSGLILGSAVGASNASASGFGQQARYDDAYTQCMYAKGHRVPVSGSMAATQRPAAPRYTPPPGPVPPAPRADLPPAPRADAPPPPPAGLPPAPPPR